MKQAESEGEHEEGADDGQLRGGAGGAPEGRGKHSAEQADAQNEAERDE